ncbi:hypothetical protein GOBAR_AA26677 [Gossypium barbadense]|uniref:Uncharacterized protein n=1 Tax=Gossypium barbadense TaxID=3634 RepID=A0A2P5WSG8_GOSBA|nr:hypothetical protein GOBAR_AA26677 [Gossypium barbadense]
MNACCEASSGGTNHSEYQPYGHSMDNKQLNHMGSLPSNTEPNPREQLNAINIRDDKGVIEPEPELRQEIVVSKGQGELTLRVEDKTITLQAHNFGSTSRIESDHLNYSAKTNNMVQPTLQKMSLKEAHESFSSTSRRPVHEDRRLQIKELDEWRTHKPSTPDKLKICQNEPDTCPNQLKIGDKVLLDATDPHIVTTTLNEEIPLTVFSIFPFRMRSINSSNHHDHSLERCFQRDTAKHTDVLKAVQKQAPVDNTVRMTRACENLHDRGRSEPRQTRPCDTIL